MSFTLNQLMMFVRHSIHVQKPRHSDVNFNWELKYIMLIGRSVTFFLSHNDVMYKIEPTV